MGTYQINLTIKILDENISDEAVLENYIKMKLEREEMLTVEEVEAEEK